MEFIRTLLLELKEREPTLQGGENSTALPPVTIREIQHNIRKGARDLSQQWKDAVHLTRKAYDVAGEEVPKLNSGDAWAQFEHLVGVAVRELHKSRGVAGEYGKWRISDRKEFDHDKTAIPKHLMPLDTLPAEDEYLARKNNT